MSKAYLIAYVAIADESAHKKLIDLCRSEEDLWIDGEGSFEGYAAGRLEARPALTEVDARLSRVEEQVAELDERTLGMKRIGSAGLHS